MVGRRASQGVTPWDKEWFRVTFGPTYQSTSLSVLQFPITFKLGMKYPKIPLNGYSNLDFSNSACENCSSQHLISWDTEWWITVQLCHSPETCPVHPPSASLLFMPLITRLLVLLTADFLSEEHLKGIDGLHSSGIASMCHLATEPTPPTSTPYFFSRRIWGRPSGTRTYR
jgi:hypothetical protein